MPTEYFLLCLGRHLKYSSCYYPGLDARTTLSEAEEAMLGDCSVRSLSYIECMICSPIADSDSLRRVQCAPDNALLAEHKPRVPCALA